jgi:hypothetical protein
MSVEEDLGTLICMLNPYTDGSKGTMVPHTFVTAAQNPAPTPSPTPTPTPTPAPPTPNMTNIWMELDTRYADDWTFKGQPHSVNKAVRIAYRWAKTDTAGNVLYWVTDYLLVGFEGSGGGS